jgi:hypothetical protein
VSASTVASGLTPDDRFLLRSVFAWARGRGWRGSRFGSGRRWDDAAGDNEVVWWYDAEDRDAWTLLTNVVPSEVCVRSVRQAVDVLVALGILPAHLSASWLAGRQSVYDRAEFRVTTPDGQRPGSNGPMYSVVDAFKTLGFWRRNGWHDAYLERRWDKEPGDWERVSDVQP